MKNESVGHHNERNFQSESHKDDFEVLCLQQTLCKKLFRVILSLHLRRTKKSDEKSKQKTNIIEIKSVLITQTKK